MTEKGRAGLRQTRKNSAQAGQDGFRREPASQEASLAHAAYYGLYLRTVEGLAPDEAAFLVMEHYPQARPFLERLTRLPAVDPLAGLSNECGEWINEKDEDS